MNKLKRYLLFLVGLFINALGVSLMYQSKSWYIADFIDSVCIKPELSIYTGKFYHIL